MRNAHWLQKRRIESPDFVTTCNQKRIYERLFLCWKPKFSSSDKLVTWVLLCTLYWQMSSNPIWGQGTSQRQMLLVWKKVRIEHDSSSSELWMTELDETNLQTTDLFCQLPTGNGDFSQMYTAHVENIVLGESRGRNVISASPRPRHQQ